MRYAIRHAIRRITQHYAITRHATRRAMKRRQLKSTSYH
jgi:hypothetical protein